MYFSDLKKVQESNFSKLLVTLNYMFWKEAENLFSYIFLLQDTICVSHGTGFQEIDLWKTGL